MPRGQSTRPVKQRRPPPCDQETNVEGLINPALEKDAGGEREKERESPWEEGDERKGALLPLYINPCSFFRYSTSHLSRVFLRCMYMCKGKKMQKKNEGNKKSLATHLVFLPSPPVPPLPYMARVFVRVLHHWSSFPSGSNRPASCSSAPQSIPCSCVLCVLFMVVVVVAVVVVLVAVVVSIE